MFDKKGYIENFDYEEFKRMKTEFINLQEENKKLKSQNKKLQDKIDLLNLLKEA
jgi:cell shape-determining protein MreC